MSLACYRKRVNMNRIGLTIYLALASIIIIIIVNSRFLQRPQKRSHENQLIHQRLSKTNSTGRGVKIQRLRQADSQKAKADGVWS